MREKERVEKLKKLRKRLRMIHEQLAEEANTSVAVQANVRMAVDICEKEIYYYENLKINAEAVEVILKGEKDEEVKYWIVESNPDPTQNVVSKDSQVGRRLLRTRKGFNVEIGDKKYKLVKRSRIKLEI